MRSVKAPAASAAAAAPAAGRERKRSAPPASQTPERKVQPQKRPALPASPQKPTAEASPAKQKPAWSPAGKAAPKKRSAEDATSTHMQRARDGQYGPDRKVPPNRGFGTGPKPPNSTLVRQPWRMSQLKQVHACGTCHRVDGHRSEQCRANQSKYESSSRKEREDAGFALPP